MYDWERGFILITMLQNIMCTDSLFQSQKCEFTTVTNDATEVMTLILLKNLKHQVCSIGILNILAQHSRNTTISGWVGGESQMKGTSCLASDC